MLRRCTIFRRTSFLTDVEGDFSYLLRFAEMSKVVAWRNGSLVFRDDSSHFVYGGDAFDRGEDLRFSRALIDFYDAHPTRVHLILGNRDINKMVFGAPTEHVLATMPTPEEAQRLTFPAAMQKMLPHRSPTYAEYLFSNGLPPVTSKATLVQWALKWKLGCPDTFNDRRNELLRIEREGSVSARETISDDEVAESFLREARAGGVYHEYIRRAKIAVVREGVLFVHGGVSEENLNFVPDERGPEETEAETKTLQNAKTKAETETKTVDTAKSETKTVDTAKSETKTVDTAKSETKTVDTAKSETKAKAETEVNAETVETDEPAVSPARRSALDWFRALNAFQSRAFSRWASGADDGLALRRYGLPQSAAPFSVTVGAAARESGPRYAALGVVEYLNRSGVAAMCSGHRPTGDTPCIVQQPGMMAIAADNSYSGEKGSRGKSVVEVVVEEDGTCWVHGKRANGTPYGFDATDPLIGRHLGDGWWVKVKVGADLYEAQRTRDCYRNCEVQILRTEEVVSRLRMWKEAPVKGEAAEWWTKQDLAPKPKLIKTKRTRCS